MDDDLALSGAPRQVDLRHVLDIFLRDTSQNVISLFESLPEQQDAERWAHRTPHTGTCMSLYHAQDIASTRALTGFCNHTIKAVISDSSNLSTVIFMLTSLTRRKRRLLLFLHNTKQRLLRLIVVAKWASKVCVLARLLSYPKQFSIL